MAAVTGLLREAAENPHDDAPRLVLADWLEDHGEPERAEFVRVQLALARLAHADWLACAAAGRPGREATSRSMIDRTLVARGVLGTVESAMNAAGGAAFFRRYGLEQLFRDAQGARFHPMQEGAQRAFTARAALGLDV